MSARPTRSYACRHCGYRSAKWLGRCPGCEAWDAFDEETASPAAHPARPAARAVPWPEVTGRERPRLATGLAELDRVLGGGLVAGGVVLLGGEPGVGKSTLLLQAVSRLADDGHRVLYVSGEESAAQLRLRGDRLGVGSAELHVLAETGVETMLAVADELRPSALVVDSIQAVRCDGVDSVPGSVTQVRESAGRLVEHAKRHDLPVVLVGHVTKDGAIAGPRLLEHLVDTVLHFEGDRHHAHRVLRTLKNRFGPADELGVFRMVEGGLAEVGNPSELFLAERPAGAPGSAVLAAVEGSRPLLVEIQALIGEPAQGTPRRTSLGVDGGRVAMILAVLQRRAGLPLADRDVFVNVTGGLTITEPAADLAVAAAAASSHRGIAVPQDRVVLGEIGLTGEIRAVGRIDARLREAARLGFRSAVVPRSAASVDAPPGLTLLPAADVAEALERLASAQIG